VIEDSDTYNGTGDWTSYRNAFGLSTAYPSGSYTQVHPGGCADPGTNADDGEAAIDVELATAFARTLPSRTSRVRRARSLSAA